MSPRRAAVLRGRDRSLREHLVTAAERLISRHGTAGLTVRDIAREAQVAVGVLYNHFADKEELLAHALHAHVRSVQRTLGEPPRRPGAGTVEGNLRAYAAHGLALYAVTLPAFAGLPARPEGAEAPSRPEAPARAEADGATFVTADEYSGAVVLGRLLRSWSTLARPRTSNTRPTESLAPCRSQTERTGHRHISPGSAWAAGVGTRVDRR